MKVMIVDDSQENRYLLQSVFRGAGHSADSASNGQEALTALRSGGYDLVVTDILMPVMDGFEFCRRVRTDEKLGSIPLIIYTATYTGPQDEAFSREIGADLFIVKPCDPLVFLESAQKLVSESSEGTITTRPIPTGEQEVYKLYSQRLVRKLEEKNLRLEAEIAARTKTEEALQRSEAKYKRLFENMRDGLVNTDTGGVIQDTSDSFAIMLGFEPGALKGSHIHMYLQGAPEDPERTVIAKQLRSRGFTDVHRAELRRKDGSFLHAEVRTVIVPGEQGESEGVWSIVRDVTDAVNAEEKRKSLELDLYQAQKMETVGRLAGGIAHDFNNLLTVILGYAEMLIGTNTFDDHSREHLGLIHHAALKARDLTRNLLSFSRRKLFNLSPVDVNEVVKDFSRLLERIVGEETEFRLALNPTPLVVLGDRSQLDQVLMNLVVNARDSMTKGGVLTVETGVANRNGSTGLEGDYATIKVSDTGCGMDEETVSHIFEPFFSTKSRDKGTGLGLATTYGIVNQHGGSISVNTKPGHGTSMVVFLPVTNQTISLSEGDTPEGALPDGSATILVMEDDPVVRSLSVQLLRSNGYDVIEASDSHEAVAMCASYEGPLHLILSDLVMPGMSGIEACEEIRKLHPETRVLFMSGYEEEANASRIVGWKPEGFIQKPFTISNLLDKCRQILGHG